MPSVNLSRPSAVISGPAVSDLSVEHCGSAARAAAVVRRRGPRQLHPLVRLHLAARPPQDARLVPEPFAACGRGDNLRCAQLRTDLSAKSLVKGELARAAHMHRNEHTGV